MLDVSLNLAVLWATHRKRWLLAGTRSGTERAGHPLRNTQSRPVRTDDVDATDGVDNDADVLNVALRIPYCHHYRRHRQKTAAACQQPRDNIALSE
jgi:hypothetical protein